MKYTIKFTDQFKRDLKLAKNQSKDINFPNMLYSLSLIFPLTKYSLLVTPLPIYEVSQGFFASILIFHHLTFLIISLYRTLYINYTLMISILTLSIIFFINTKFTPLLTNQYLLYNCHQ